MVGGSGVWGPTECQWCSITRQYQSVLVIPYSAASGVLLVRVMRLSMLDGWGDRVERMVRAVWRQQSEHHHTIIIFDPEWGGFR